MRIDLEVRPFVDLEALDHGLTLSSFRLVARVQFRRQGDDWTSLLPALVDTGALFCVLPKTLWMTIASRQSFVTGLRGLVPLREATLKARMAHITYIVSDLKTNSQPIHCWALLADGEVPLVLGCSGFLDQGRLTLDAPRRLASLEW